MAISKLSLPSTDCLMDFSAGIKLGREPERLDPGVGSDHLGEEVIGLCW